MCVVFCSISAMLDGTIFSSEQLSCTERHLRETVKQASHSADDVRITSTFTVILSSG